MKRLVYLSVFILGLFLANPGHAQVSIHINIGSQPAWGPAGFDYARYYYLPALDMYYDVINQRYVYWDGYYWASRASLPVAYNNVNLYSLYKVVLNDANPWNYHAIHHIKYAPYANHYNQLNIRDYRYANTYVSKREKNPAVDNRVVVRDDRGRSPVAVRSTGSRNSDTGSRVVQQVR